MATSIINQTALDENEVLYALYNKLYNGMCTAQQVVQPDYVTNPPHKKNPDNTDVLDDYGDWMIDVDEVARQITEYTEVQTQNAAYMFANAIFSTFAGDSSGSGSGESGIFVSRTGDSMDGLLTANNGFQAGYNNTKIFDVSIIDNTSVATVYGNCSIQGVLRLSDSGLSVGSSSLLFIDKTDPTKPLTTLQGDEIMLDGNVEVSGDFKAGKLEVSTTEIKWDGNEIYHKGNCNNATSDWEMNNATINGTLTVRGTASLCDKLAALHGFELGFGGVKKFYNDGNFIQCDADINVDINNGIKLGGSYILKARNGTGDTLSFSAPGMVLNLGDGDNGTPTQQISLQSDIYDYTNAYKLITKEGKAYFPNGLTVKAVGAGNNVLETYNDTDKEGLLVNQRLWLGATNGPYISRFDSNDPSDARNGLFAVSLPYNSDYHTYILDFVPTQNPFIDDSIATQTLLSDIEGDAFRFAKPLEAPYFLVKKNGAATTALMENQLFFDRSKYLESVTQGIRWVGDAIFNNDLSSPVFTSGFAGSGWAVKRDVTIGGYRATFDDLTVRRKMRVYEFEVQKISATNGSLWISDSCSGDEVIALN